MPISPPLRSNKRNCGFTLLELVVTMAIIGLILTVGATQANRFFDVDMKKATERLGATMRYLYNKAATEGLYIRLVFDFEKQSYWVEATTDPYLMVDQAELDRRRERQKKTTSSGTKRDEESEEKELRSKEAVFSQVGEQLLKAQKLPTSVFLKDIFVEHHEGALDSGQATIAFFPHGYVERAVVNLRDEDDEVHFSLKTNPVTGQVNIEQSYRKLDDD